MSELRISADQLRGAIAGAADEAVVRVKDGAPTVATRSFFERVVHFFQGGKSGDALRRAVLDDLGAGDGSGGITREVAEQAFRLARTGTGSKPITVGQIREAHIYAKTLSAEETRSVVRQRALDHAPERAEAFARIADDAGVDPDAERLTAQQKAYYKQLLVQQAALQPERYLADDGALRELAIRTLRHVASLDDQRIGAAQELMVSSRRQAQHLIYALGSRARPATLVASLERLQELSSQLPAVPPGPGAEGGGEIGLAMALERGVAAISPREARQLYQAVTAEGGAGRGLLAGLAGQLSSTLEQTLKRLGERGGVEDIEQELEAFKAGRADGTRAGRDVAGEIATPMDRAAAVAERVAAAEQLQVFADLLAEPDPEGPDLNNRAELLREAAGRILQLAPQIQLRALDLVLAEVQKLPPERRQAVLDSLLAEAVAPADQPVRADLLPVLLTAALGGIGPGAGNGLLSEPGQRVAFLHAAARVLPRLPADALPAQMRLSLAATARELGRADAAAKLANINNRVPIGLAAEMRRLPERERVALFDEIARLTEHLTGAPAGHLTGAPGKIEALATLASQLASLPAGARKPRADGLMQTVIATMPAPLRLLEASIYHLVAALKFASPAVQKVAFEALQNALVAPLDAEAPRRAAAHRRVDGALAGAIRTLDRGVQRFAAQGQCIKRNLGAADLSGCDLSEAKLDYADLRDANLVGANLKDTYFYRAGCQGADFTNADLRRANFGFADLSRAILRQARLDRSNLHAANLRGADLCGASLAGAGFGDANLGGADLRGAKLAGAKLLYARCDLTDVRLDAAGLAALLDEINAIPVSALTDVEERDHAFNHLANGRSMLTAIDSIPAEHDAAKVRLMEALLAKLERAAQRGNVSNVSRSVVDILGRNPLYTRESQAIRDGMARVLAAEMDRCNHARIDGVAANWLVMMMDMISDRLTRQGWDFAQPNGGGIFQVLNLARSQDSKALDEQAADIHERYLAALPDADAKRLAEKMTEFTGEDQFPVLSAAGDSALLLADDHFNKCVRGQGVELGKEPWAMLAVIRRDPSAGQPENAEIGDPGRQQPRVGRWAQIEWHKLDIAAELRAAPVLSAAFESQQRSKTTAQMLALMFPPDAARAALAAVQIAHTPVKLISPEAEEALQLHIMPLIGVAPGALPDDQRTVQLTDEFYGKLLDGDGNRALLETNGVRDPVKEAYFCRCLAAVLAGLTSSHHFGREYDSPLAPRILAVAFLNKAEALGGGSNRALHTDRVNRLLGLEGAFTCTSVLFGEMKKALHEEQQRNPALRSLYAATIPVSW